MDIKLSAKEEITKKIMDYIALHQTEELSLDIIARELNYSKFYMERVFVQTMGITIHKYIQECRLAQAAGQLEKTDRPVVEIAFDAGYGSHPAFTQAFRKRYQCSPQDYRKKQRFSKKSVSGKNLLYQGNSPFIFRRLLYDNRKGRAAA